MLDIVSRDTSRLDIDDDPLDMLLTLISNIPGIAYRCRNEPNWEMEFVSDGAEELTGYIPSEIQEGNVTWGEDIIHPDDRERVWNEVQDGVENNEPFKIKYRILTKNGEEKWVWEQGRKTDSYEDGDTEYLEGVIIDITSQREQRDELFLKERAMDAAPIGITISETTNDDGDNPLVYVNEGFTELTGYPAEEIIGKDCRFLQGEKTESEPVAEIRRGIDNEEPVSVEIRNYRKDGTEFWNRVDIAPVYDENDELVNFVGFQRDITERKEYEKKLKQFKKAAEHAGYAIYVTDKDGKIEYVNPEFERVTGYSKDEAIGETPSILKSEERGEEYYDRLWDTVLSGNVWEEEVVNRRKSGEFYTAEQTIAPIKGDDGEIEGFIAIH
ncbi:MAG: PAS domain S-box protein, partial [Halobacteria archaeon]|nr:PAS domain S-box protein [Halobacteria archaeon]